MQYIPGQAPANLDTEGVRRFTEEELRNIARVVAEGEMAIGALQAAVAMLNAGVSGGQCKLVATQSSPTLTLRPFGGGALKINGTFQLVPAAGVVYTASGLLVGVIYYIYAFMSGTTITLEASLTGHSTSSTAGNVGTEIKTGDDTRSLVGMAYTNAANGNWDDTVGRRLVRSWFNDWGVVGGFNESGVVNTTSVTYVDAMTSRSYVLMWQNEQYFAAVGAQAFNNVVGAIVYVLVLVDGVSVGPLGMQQASVANFQSWAETHWVGTLAEGLHNFTMGYMVSGGGATGQVASRVVSYTTMRR